MVRGSAGALCVAALALVFASTSTARAEGALRARRADGHELGLFPLARTDVHAEVAGQVTSVAVTQRFRNPFSERIEAVYVFPLPVGAAVDELELRVADRVVRAEVRRRDDARRAYERARDQGQHAALLEQERPNVFTFSVANIDPGGELEVRLRYFDLARYDHGTYEMVVPLVVGPRYVPGDPLPRAPSGTGPQADTDRVPDASRISTTYLPPGTRSGHAIGLRVQLDAGAPIQQVEAPAHDIVLEQPGATVARVSLRDKDEIPNRDFVLRWRLAAPTLQTALLAHRPDARGDGYLALVLEPRHDAPPTELAARELFFVLDTSGSMQGPPLETAVAAVRRALAGLAPGDSFQLIDFADQASSFAPAPLPNTPANLRRAEAYLAELRASGGTNQLAGIHAALAAPGDPMRLRYVVFMTDGYIGNEAEVLALTRREIGAARIFGFGVGGSVNRYLLDEVSLAGRGVAEYLRPGEDPAALVERFYQRIGSPWLTGVEVAWEGGAVTEQRPASLPDLSQHQPLVVLARYRSPGPATVTVRGRVGGRPFERRVAVELPPLEAAHGAIARVWARETIATLERATHLQGETTELVEAITRVALEHHLVSRYTSLVAVDERAPAAGSAGRPVRVVQPAEAPAGVNLQSAGGVMVSYPFTLSGGGGIGEGTIGLGAIGTMGHGGGGQGLGQGYGRGVGLGLRGAGSPAPTVRAAPPAVTGSLAPETIRRVVLRNLGQVNHCYSLALAREPTLSGRVVVRFVIGANGSVASAVVSASSLARPAVEQCIASALRRWQFPAPPGGSLVTVNYPFVFEVPSAPQRPAGPTPSPAATAPPATPALPPRRR